MREEWHRPLTWTDRALVKYKSNEEWAYVNGPAKPAKWCADPSRVPCRTHTPVTPYQTRAQTQGDE
jgi:hypothetical protein